MYASVNQKGEIESYQFSVLANASDAWYEIAHFAVNADGTLSEQTDLSDEDLSLFDAVSPDLQYFIDRTNTLFLF